MAIIPVFLARGEAKPGFWHTHAVIQQIEVQMNAKHRPERAKYRQKQNTVTVC